MKQPIELRPDWKSKQPSAEEKKFSDRIREFLIVFDTLHKIDVTFAELSLYDQMEVDSSVIRKVVDSLSAQGDEDDLITSIRKREFAAREDLIEKTKQRFRALKKYILGNKEDPRFLGILAEDIQGLLEHESEVERFVGVPINIESVDLLVQFIIDEGIDIDLERLFTSGISDLAKAYPPDLSNAQSLFAIAKKRCINIDTSNQYLKDNWARAVQRAVFSVACLERLVDFLKENNIGIDYSREPYIIEACRTNLYRSREELKEATREAYARLLGLEFQ